MPYRADVTEPDPNPNIISKYLSEPGPARWVQFGYPSSSPHSIPGWEKNVLWFIGISLNQSQSKELVLVENVYVQKLFQSCNRKLRLDR